MGRKQKNDRRNRYFNGLLPKHCGCPGAETRFGKPEAFGQQGVKAPLGFRGIEEGVKGVGVDGVMKGIFKIVLKFSRWMNMVAGVFLAFIVLITVADVILRSFKRPILGTYELVALSGAIIIGFSIPITSWLKGHIYVDFFILKLPQAGRKIFGIITKCMGIGLFLVMGSNLIILGMELYKSGEVSPTLHIPFYFVVYAIGVCCFFQCAVLFCDIVKIFGGEYE